MLEDKKITVIVNDQYTVEENYPDERADIIDTIKAENPSIGIAKLNSTANCEVFVQRVKAWCIDQECTETNKRIFFKQFSGAARDIINKADELIEQQRSEQLKNLLAGASGN